MAAKSWIKKLDKINLTREDTPPDFEKDEWFTVKDLMKEYKVGDNRARKIINEGMATLQIECYKGSEWSKEKNQLVRRAWYRFIS